VVLTRLIWLT